ncbi:hypothetical protein GCM10020331_069640 [Ectobacillus funiculus]
MIKEKSVIINEYTSSEMLVSSASSESFSLKTRNVYASWIAHALADLVALGLFMYAM